MEWQNFSEEKYETFDFVRPRVGACADRRLRASTNPRADDCATDCRAKTGIEQFIGCV